MLLQVRVHSQQDCLIQMVLYSNTVYAGTKVVFELTMQTVSQPNVPMLTNAYVKETFGYDTIEEYRQSIKESLETDINSKVENKIQEDVLSSLQDTFKISSYPDSLMEEQDPDLKHLLVFMRIFLIFQRMNIVRSSMDFLLMTLLRNLLHSSLSWRL